MNKKPPVVHWPVGERPLSFLIGVQVCIEKLQALIFNHFLRFFVGLSDRLSDNYCHRFLVIII